MKLLACLVRDHSRFVVLCFVLVASVAAIVATGVRIDGSVDALMMSADPLRGRDLLAKEEFGNDEVFVAAFELDHAFTADDLQKLKALSDAISAVPDVSSVLSLATTEDIRGADGGVDASPLIDFDRLDDSIERIRARVRGHRLYRKALVSEQEDVLGMYVFPDVESTDSEALSQMTQAVVALVERDAAPWRVYFAGYPITAFEADRIVKRDLTVLTPVALLTICVIVYYFTRRVFPLVLLLAMIGWVELIAHAWLAFTDTPINVVVSGLPTILMATASTYVIYAVGVLAEVADDPEPGVAIVRLMFRSVLLSALSTGIGFCSLSFINVAAIGELGVALGVGIGAAAVGTLCLIPALVQLCDLRLHTPSHPLLTRASMIGVRTASRPWLVIGATALLVGLAVPGIFRIAVETDTLAYFAPGNRVRVGGRFFQDHLSSSFVLNVVIRGHEPGRALDPDVLELAERIEADLKTMPQVDRTVSMLDYFALMDSVLHPEREPRAAPGSRAAAAQYMLLYESSADPEDYARYINYDRSALSMLVHVHDGSRMFRETAEHVYKLVASAPPDVEVTPVGSAYLYTRAMDALTHGMVLGLTTTAILIGLIMVIGLRSFGLAFIAALPNLAPIVIWAGLLGWLDIPLSMGTSLVGCVALGLAVDDTAHVMGHVSKQHSLEWTYGLVGQPVVLTTVALGCGFATLMLSEFQTIAAFGAVTAFTLVVALLGDVILLPALLAVAGYRVRDDVIAEDPRTDAGQEDSRAEWPRVRGAA